MNFFTYSENSFWVFVYIHNGLQLHRRRARLAGRPRPLAARRLHVGRFVKFICIFSHNLTCEISHDLSYLGLFCFVVPFRPASFFMFAKHESTASAVLFYFYHNGGFCIETYNQLRSSRLGKIGLRPNVRTTRRTSSTPRSKATTTH